MDTRSAVPPFEQVRAQVAARAASGELPPGARLPTVRALAELLGIAPNTVARAYRQLEAAGVVETRGRLGTFVSASSDARERAAFDAAREYAHRMRGLSMSRDEAAAWLDRAWPTSATPAP